MRQRCWVTFILTIPIIFVGSRWVGFLLAIPVLWWGGWVFLSRAVAALRRRTLDMHVLIATGVTAAYLASVYLTVIAYPATYYDAAAMLVTLVLFGHWMVMKSERGTKDALRALLALVPPTARRLEQALAVLDDLEHALAAL